MLEKSSKKTVYEPEVEPRLHRKHPSHESPTLLIPPNPPSIRIEQLCEDTARVSVLALLHT